MTFHKRRLSGLVFFFLLASTLFSESYNTISDEIFKYFSEKNMQQNVQYLSNSQSDQFPYNIIIPSNSRINAKSHLYFIISDRDALSNPELVKLLSNSGNVVICANMTSALPSEYQTERYAGLTTFLQTAPSDAILVILTPDSSLNKDEMQLVPGGNGRIISHEVLQTLMRAAQLSDFSVSVQSLLLTFYRLNWVDGSDTAALCLENGFQATELLIPENADPRHLDEYAQILTDLLSGITPSTSQQYSVINTGTNVISISDSFYTTILFIILSGTLLSSCLFSFMFGKRKQENRKIFLTWWYTGPLFVLIVFALTCLAQTVVVSLFNNYQIHPACALTLKAAFIAVSFFLLCELRYIVPLAQTDYLYSFFMTLAATFDVFIFASADMPLLLPFTIIYIVFMCSRPVKKWWINLIILLLLTAPLIFVLVKASPYLRNDIFASFTASSILIDFFTGALLLPFLLMVIRIFIGLGLWDKNRGRKHILIETGILSCILILIVTLSATLYRNEAPSVSESDAVIVLSSDTVGVKADASISNGMLSFAISLSGNGLHSDTSDESAILRHDVSLHSDAVIPVFSANLPFSFTETPGSVVFNLDENPCNPFTVSGTMPSVFPVEFSIVSWLKEGSVIYKEEHSVVLDEENAGKNSHIRTIIK